MNVAEIQKAAAALAAQITALVQSFETATGCLVHSLPVRPASGKIPTSVEVKVQIP
jgi:hypothetical protein